jgi:hypothetical protein
MRLTPTMARRTRRDVKAVALAATVGLVLAACGCGSSGSFSTAGTSPTSAAAATAPASTGETNTSSSATGKVASGGTTPAGTKLTTGATAVVDYEPEEGPGKPTFHLQLNVLSIKKGAQADMNGVDLDKAQQGQTPYYVTLQVRNIGAGDASANDGNPAVPFQATDDRGGQGQELTLLGTFRPCESVLVPKQFTTGVTYKTCVVYMVGGGGSIVAENWTGSGGDAYSENPIVWKTS